MRRLTEVVACGAVALAAVGAGVALAWPSTRPGPLTPASVPGVSCRAQQVGGEWLPDLACTPGALNPAVNDGNLRSTICLRGWATRQRAALFPYSVSEPVKRHLVRAYAQYAGPPLGAYELDHLVPLSAGGAVADTLNLWPEAPATPNRKDRVEAAANKAVCTGRMTLAHVQAGFMNDWRQLGVELGVPTTGAALIGGDVDE